MTKGISCLLNRFAILFALLFTIGVGQMWGTRLFQTGQKVYFQDATLTSTMSGNRWKSGTNGNVYAYFFNQKDHVGDDVTNWAEGAGKLVYGTDGAANAIYEFTVPSLPSGGDGVWWGVIFTRGTAASWDGRWNQTTNQYPADEKSLFTIADNKDGDNWTGSWSVMPEMLCSSITSPEWSKEDGLFFTDYSGEKGIVKINCTASQSFQFIVFDGTYYKSYADETNTTWADYGPKTDGGYNFQFQAGEAGEYIFQWDKTNHKLWVWEPKARFTKQKYIYFDARNLKGSGSDYWQIDNFTARFWFKYYDSGSDKGSVDCAKASALEDWVYYALVPDDEYLGRIQMNKMVGGTLKCDPSESNAKNRDNASQNCLKEESGKENWCTGWTPQWTTYCPPTTSETFTDNSTTKISWQPNTNDGSTSAKAIWVKTGTTLKVAATASKAVADDNMTIKYDFKVNSTSQQDGTTASYTHSASTNNTTYELSADIYTNYNLDNTKNSTKHTQSSIFYKALDTYSVTHTLSGVTKASGRAGDDAAAYYVAYDATYTANIGYYLPSDVTVTIGGVTKTKDTDYTWTVTDGTSGTLNILSSKIDGNVVVTINGVWRWSVAGTWKYYDESDTEDADTYAMGNITKVSSDDVCSVEITLPANTNYTFKIVDRSTSPYTWLGNSNDGSAPFYMAYGNSTDWGFDDDYSKACGITTAGAGTYTFTYNITDRTLTVTYPTSYTVTYGWQAGMPDGTDVTASVGGNAVASGGYVAAESDVTFTETHPTGFTFNGWYTTQDGNTPVSGMGTSDNVLDNIGANATVYAQYTENHFDVTAAASPATGGIVTPASATSFGQYYGGDISATPYIGYGFTGWTGGTGAYVDASLMSTKFKPTANSTVTAGFSRRYAFIEGNFQIYNQARNSQTKTGNAFVDNSTAIQMEWDDTNHWFYLHTYSTPAELAANLNDAEAWFYIMTSSANNALSNTCAYKSASGANQALSTKGNKKTASYDQSQSFHFTGSDAGYVVLYFDGESVWYDLEYKVTYDGNSNTSGTAPALAYYAEGSTPAAETNEGDLARAGYVFRGWSTSSGVNQAVAYETGATMSAMSADVTLYAKWTPAILTFTGTTNSDWNDASNWSPACVPTINHDVVLNVPVEVNIDHAVAKSIVINQNGDNTGSLTIQANKGLEVAGTITKTTDGETYSATTPADLVLESSASGNATLIFNNSNNCQATVQMYSKGWTTGTQGSGTWNWQTVGVPVIDATRINDYYDGYMYEWNTSTRTWDDVTDTEALLTEFKAYSVTYPTTSDKLHTYSIDGTLVPTGDKTIDVAASSVQAAANSWTAPIRINDIRYTDWSPATIFLYNTGYNPDVDNKADKSGERYAAGKYLPIPVSSAPYLGESYIAPMQGFFFKSASAGTITLNYANAVRTYGSKEIVAGEMHAPKRAMAAEPVVMKIYVSDSLYDDRVVLLARNDFSRGFDNGWDGEKFQVNAVTTAPRLFAINETGGKEEVSAIPELENTVIGFRPGKEETYTIHFDYNGDETLYLRDTRTGAETLITNESKYVFLSDGTNEDARFIISRVQSTPTGTEEIGAGSKAYKLMIEDHIYIIRDGRMYSVDGALVNLERK